jgi:C1A family cysteine protease
LGSKVPKDLKKDTPLAITKEEILKVPKSVDWEALGKLTSVKSQGDCGSCWAFTTLATIESLYLIKKNKYLDLSE